MNITQFRSMFPSATPENIEKRTNIKVTEKEHLDETV